MSFVTKMMLMLTHFYIRHVHNSGMIITHYKSFNNVNMFSDSLCHYVKTLAFPNQEARNEYKTLLFTLRTLAKRWYFSV